MKLVRYRHQGKELCGVVRGEDVFELRGDPLGEYSISESCVHLSDVLLLAPCRPGKVVAAAINYAGIDGFSGQMSEPMLFVKPGSSVCGPGQVIRNPFPGLPMWGEPELAAVVGRIPPKVNPANVRDAVIGFTIANDVTVENIEGRDHHLSRSKCADNFCPLGPWIDTDFNPDDCLIEAYQDGTLIRQGRSSDQFWTWEKIILSVSRWMTLEPWDVILTGNPPDIGGLRLVTNGTHYRARVEGLGDLVNTFE